MNATSARSSACRRSFWSARAAAAVTASRCSGSASSAAVVDDRGDALAVPLDELHGASLVRGGLRDAVTLGSTQPPAETVPPVEPVHDVELRIAQRACKRVAKGLARIERHEQLRDGRAREADPQDPEEEGDRDGREDATKPRLNGIRGGRRHELVEDARRAMRGSAACPGDKTGQRARAAPGLARRQRRTRSATAIATRTSPAAGVDRLEHVDRARRVGERERVVGAALAARGRGRSRTGRSASGEHDERRPATIGNARSKPRLEPPRRMGEEERRERHERETAEEEPDDEEPRVVGFGQRSEEPDVTRPRPGRSPVRFSGRSAKRDQAADHEGDASGDREADVGPPCSRATWSLRRDAATAATDRLDDERARAPKASVTGLKRQEGAETRSPESSALATKPHAHDEATSRRSRTRRGSRRGSTSGGRAVRRRAPRRRRSRSCRGVGRRARTMSGASCVDGRERRRAVLRLADDDESLRLRAWRAPRRGSSGGRRRSARCGPWNGSWQTPQRRRSAGSRTTCERTYVLSILQFSQSPCNACAMVLGSPSTSR